MKIRQIEFKTYLTLTAIAIAENPVNPDKTFKFQSDSDAFSYLKEHPKEIYSSTFEARGKLIQRFYTSDTATVKDCVTCHVKHQGPNIKIGDI